MFEMKAKNSAEHDFRKKEAVLSESKITLSKIFQPKSNAAASNRRKKIILQNAIFSIDKEKKNGDATSKPVGELKRYFALFFPARFNHSPGEKSVLLKELII